MTLPALLEGRLRVPVMAAPMFIVSTPELVIAQCQAGIVGSFPALNARAPAELDAWLGRIKAALEACSFAHPERPAAPFAVNLIVHRSNHRLDTDLALCVRRRVPLVITSLGAREDVNDAIHAYGGRVFHDVISNDFARKAIAKGADGLIAVASGAGGHAGRQSPFALVREIRQWFDGPLLLSGAIASGDSILAAQAMGADLAYIGSAFIATREANAHDRYKQCVVDSSAADVVYTDLFTGLHGNYLRASIVGAGLDPDRLPSREAAAMDFGSGGGTDAKVWRDIWGCGQGIGPIDRVQSTAQLVDQLHGEYQRARERLLAA